MARVLVVALTVGSIEHLPVRSAGKPVDSAVNATEKRLSRRVWL
jgi:hypothetical protein